MEGPIFKVDRALLLDGIVGGLALVVWVFLFPRLLAADNYGLFLVVVACAVILAHAALCFIDRRGMGDPDPCSGIEEWNDHSTRLLPRVSSLVLPMGRACFLVGNLEVLLIAAMLDGGLKEAAHYGVAFCLGAFVGVPGRILGPRLKGALEKGRAAHDVDEGHALIRAFTLLTSLIGGYVLLLLWILLDDFYEALPSAYASAAQVALIVGTGYLAANVLRVVAQADHGSGDERSPFLIGTVASLLYISVAFVMVHEFGVQGAGWATLLALIARFAMPAVRGLRSYGASLLEWRVIVVLVLVGVLGLIIPWIPLSGSTITDVLMRNSMATILFWSAAHVLGLLRGLGGLAPYLRL